MFTRALTRSLRARPKPGSVAQSWRQSYSTAPKVSDPLRILFCGSDKFSCESLQALHDEQKQNADLIRSIDVVVRPSKPTGRGYKVMREVPIRGLAEQLDLPVHVRDTFTGWDMPRPDGDAINLIIAVSFGLFVPPRLIHASKYGGLNVHPSLLPDLRGPAPLHHALLSGRTHTGVTIQTLSPAAFDAGVPLLQTPAPGIPIPPDCSLAALHDRLAAEGASMLVEALRRGLHVPPHQSCLSDGHHHPAPAPAFPPQPSPQPPPSQPDPNRNPPRGPPQTATPPIQPQHAPKITPADKQLPWTSPAGARAAAVRFRVLGPLWTHLRRTAGAGAVETKRVLLEPVEAISLSDAEAEGLVTDRSGGGSNNSSGGKGGYVRWVVKGGGPGPAPSGGSGRAGDAAGEGEEEFVGRYHPARGDVDAVVVQMSDGSWLRIGRIKVEGSTWKPARSVLDGAMLAGN